MSTKEEDTKIKAILKSSDPSLKTEHDALFKAYHDAKRNYINFRQRILKPIPPEDDLADAKRFIDREILKDEKRVAVIKRMINRQLQVEKELDRQCDQLPEDEKQGFYIRSHSSLERLAFEFSKVFMKFQIPYFTEENQFQEQRRELVNYIQDRINTC